MSKRDRKKTSETREPWEQSIYETDKNSGGSRLEKRQQKKGNTLFLTILVVLLLLIIALPVGTYLYMTRDNSDSNKGATKASSSVVVESSTKKQSESTTKASSSAEQASSSAASTEQEQSSSSSQETTPSSSSAAEGEAVYTQVLAGEGPNQVAARNGITTEQLLQLNGISLDTTIHPGDSLRVK